MVILMAMSHDNVLPRAAKPWPERCLSAHSKSIIHVVRLLQTWTFRFPDNSCSDLNQQPPAFKHRVLRIVSILVFLTAPASTVSTSGDERGDFFEIHIRPLLLEKCIECHGPKKQEQGIRLDRRSDVLSGKLGEVALVEPGAPLKSRLFQVLQHTENDIAMPSSGKLEAAAIDAVGTWIANGAIWPETSNLEAEAIARSELWRKHWAFQPVRSPPLTGILAEQNPIDFLIQQKLQSIRVAKSPEAERAILVRRWSYAITGLPPELADLKAARECSDSEWPAWKLQYADQLLSSPQFGERWARHWMDVARYADTKGYVFQEDREYKDAWQYREWLIRSFNSDMPYDEFLKRQLSADRMPGSSDPQQLAAMGYLTLGRRFLNNTHDIIDDRIDVVTRGMLGLTVACSRCHDHKYDPIPTADYYSLYGIFASSDEPKNEPSTLRLVDKEKPVEPVIFRRGSPGNHGDHVPRRFLTALSPADQVYTDGSGRLELADSIADRNNPLTGRVAVNRIWMLLFGRGFVDTPSDFGVRTNPPTHPELLDYLTTYFMDHGWSTKKLIRHIVMSETWQQSSDFRNDAATTDPENRLLARMNRRRLDFEAFRDTVLKLSGRLDPAIGGNSADIAADPNSTRRTVYARIDRQNLPGVYRTFDMPNPDTHAPVRFQTTVPQQALFQLNNPFLMNRAVDVAEQVRDSAVSSDLSPGIRELFQRILQREPELQETTAAAQFLRQIQATQQSPGVVTGWNYGYGHFDIESGQLKSFHEMPYTGQGRWSGGDKLPDNEIGWASLTKEGGHPGNPVHSVIRRWTADSDCRIVAVCSASHESEQGDGVQVLVVVNSRRVVAEVISAHGAATATASAIELKTGDTLDFVTHCRENESHDSFRTRIIVTQSVAGSVARVWNSADDFRDQKCESRLDAWAQLAQALMLTNEFMFVD
ncbi:MAG: PSD1 and planctomycete cytochrome C domain-containing protein [Planctomycetota bacterium]